VTEEELAKQDEQDIGALLATRGGVRFFARLLAMCGVYRLSYVPGDTHATALNEGQRNIGNTILADLSKAVPDYAARLKDGMKEREINEWQEKKDSRRSAGLRPNNPGRPNRPANT
jgi:hypothetical protein